MTSPNQTSIPAPLALDQLETVVRGWVQLRELDTDENGKLVVAEEIFSPFNS